MTSPTRSWCFPPSFSNWPYCNKTIIIEQFILLHVCFLMRKGTVHSCGTLGWDVTVLYIWPWPWSCDVCVATIDVDHVTVVRSSAWAEKAARSVVWWSPTSSPSTCTTLGPWPPTPSPRSRRLPGVLLLPGERQPRPGCLHQSPGTHPGTPAPREIPAPHRGPGGELLPQGPRGEDPRGSPGGVPGVQQFEGERLYTDKDGGVHAATGHESGGGWCDQSVLCKSKEGVERGGARWALG